MPVGSLLPPQHAVDLRPDQQFDLRGVRPAFDERSRTLARAPLGRRAVAQPLARLPFLPRLRRLSPRGLGRVERAGTPNATPSGLTASVVLQAAGRRAGLIRADGPQQPSAGAVLDAQHRVMRPHPSQRALAMGSENVLAPSSARATAGRSAGNVDQGSAPFAAAVMARSETRPSLGAQDAAPQPAPSRAPPNSWPAQDAASSPSPTASGDAGAWRVSRHGLQRVHIHRLGFARAYGPGARAHGSGARSPPARSPRCVRSRRRTSRSQGR